MAAPIQLRSWPTPNGHKVHVMLEEPGLPNELARLHRVLDRRLPASPFLAGPDYSIADIRSFPWFRYPDRRGIDLAHYPNPRRWHDAVTARPADQRGAQVLAERQRRGPMAGAEREIMFGKTQLAAR